MKHATLLSLASLIVFSAGPQRAETLPAAAAPVPGCAGCTIDVYSYEGYPGADADFAITFVISNPDPGYSQYAYLATHAGYHISTAYPYMSDSVVIVPAGGDAYVTGYYHVGPGCGPGYGHCGTAGMTVTNSDVPFPYIRQGIEAP